MTRKRFWKLSAGIGVLALAGAGVVWAQQHGPFRGNPEKMIDFMADYLDLTATQKALAKETFDQTQKATEPQRNQLQQLKEQAIAAVKAGRSEQELQALANAAAAPTSQLMGAHLKAMSKLYATLTQPQKDKLERLHNRFGGRFGHGPHAVVE